jgi:hypothetical protein
MAIKAVFRTGENVISVKGLFQWDYGRVLEIEAPDIGSEVMEVHFACANMKEAIVRSCSFSNGVGTVTIPDQCLEQSSAITAWVYRIIGTQGHTEKVINLIVTARTRPSIARDIPQEVSNRYTELITEVNEAVENLESGNVTVAHAKNANNAGYASSAGNASSAAYATSAGTATKANKATEATTALMDSSNNKFEEHYLKRGTEHYLEVYEEDGVSALAGGIISFRIESYDPSNDAVVGVANVIVDVCDDCYSQAFILPIYAVKEGVLVQTMCRLCLTYYDGLGIPNRYRVTVETINDGASSTLDTYRTIYYKYLSTQYPDG